MLRDLLQTQVQLVLQAKQGLRGQQGFPGLLTTQVQLGQLAKQVHWAQQECLVQLTTQGLQVLQVTLVTPVLQAYQEPRQTQVQPVP